MLFDDVVEVFDLTDLDARLMSGIAPCWHRSCRS
jgi:hypothetical protein